MSEGIDMGSALTRAISDPGRFTQRGDDYREPLVAWQVRACRIALADSGPVERLRAERDRERERADRLEQGIRKHRAVVDNPAADCWTPDEDERLWSLLDGDSELEPS